MFINVSPIEYGHVLLVPRALDNLPQLVGPDTLLLALQFAREAGEATRAMHLLGKHFRAACRLRLGLSLPSLPPAP